ncbi:MAG: adenylosuccinate lyase [Chloroflexota bacterium]
MIDRYTLPPMAELWSDRSRFEHMLLVELAVSRALADQGMVPAEAVAAMEARAQVDIERIAELERSTDHDVVAFVAQVAESVGPEGRYLHYGLTSSDVVDTGLALQCRSAADLILASLDQLIATVVRRAREHADTLQMGRTHGVHAEPLTFGLKLASWAFELDRARTRLRAAADDLATGKISGPVGSYSQLGPEIEAAALAAVGLSADAASTQIVQRDRHAAFLAAIAVTGGSIERFAVEIRNLQRTEIAELQEPFRSGQAGSSAMPHKRNPILSERLTGLSRILRGYALAGLEDQALWHERDISHSSVERIALPGATTLLHYMLERFRGLVAGLVVRSERMAENIEAGLGLHASSRLLSALIDRGMSRQAAYAMVQRSALEAADRRVTLRSLVEADPDVTSILSADDLERCFDDRAWLENVHIVIARLDGLDAGSARAAGS